MIRISQKDAQELGFKSSVQVGQDLGFTDFRKTSASNLKNAYLDLENLGPLKSKNPRLVVRKPIDYSKSTSSESVVWESWRQIVEDIHYYAKYQISTLLVGQLSEAHFPLNYYSYIDNNFFRPFVETKAVKKVVARNNYPYARFRFPKKASNTIDLIVQSKSGAQALRPKFAGLLSKEEERKTYYRWHPATTRGVARATAYDNLNLSGYAIPYPNTVSICNLASFNIPTKISPKFNSYNDQAVHGLIVISTGDAEQKTVCYVSPHGLETGLLNTVEDIYLENNRLSKSSTPGSNLLATVENASWYGSAQTGFLGTCFGFGYLNNLNGLYKETSIPSANKTHKRFYKIDEPEKQIYFDSTLPTQYGSGRWCIALSGSANININTGHNAVVYMHQPNSLTDWKKTDPRKLSGPWTTASGHPRAANGTFLNRAGISKPILSPHKTCRKTKVINTEKLQIPSLIIDSKFINNGYVFPKGIDTATHVYTGAIYPSWATYGPSGVIESGYVINNESVKMSTILESGIPIPQQVRYGVKYSIDQGEHFKQDTPLKDTYFYKFYNQLYKDHNKTIATGTWNGIVPSGVRVSIELITTTLDSEAGILNDKNIAVVYSGYGSYDSIDYALQTGISQHGAHKIYPNPSAQYVVSGEVPWTQNRSPYRHAFNDFGQLTYTAFKSGPTENDALNIAKVYAIETINSKILQLVNKVLPDASYKNKKWKRMQAFKSKIASIRSSAGSEFSTLAIPDSALPGAEIQRRLRPYSTGQA